MHRPPHLALLPWIDSNFILLPEQDDRLRVITNYFKQTGKLEIEARLGYYSINSGLSQDEKEVGQIILSANYLQILPFRKSKNFYHFEPGIKKEHYYLLKDLFDQAVKTPNSHVINKGHRSIVDTIYTNHTRVSKDLTTNLITESIEKVNRMDLNIQNKGQDIRLTSSIEEAQKSLRKDQLVVSMTRTKKRYSYDYEFMGFDLTHICSSKGEESYEVELEVRDVPYLLKYLNDHISFNKLVLRFLSNIQSLYHVLDTLPKSNSLNIIQLNHTQHKANNIPLKDIKVNDDNDEETDVKDNYNQIK